LIVMTRPKEQLLHLKQQLTQLKQQLAQQYS
jgi:hypothetical protein